MATSLPSPSDSSCSLPPDSTTSTDSNDSVVFVDNIEPTQTQPTSQGEETNWDKAFTPQHQKNFEHYFLPKTKEVPGSKVDAAIASGKPIPKTRLRFSEQDMGTGNTKSWKIVHREPAQTIPPCSPPQVEDESDEDCHTESKKMEVQCARKEKKWLAPLFPMGNTTLTYKRLVEEDDVDAREEEKEDLSRIQSQALV